GSAQGDDTSGEAGVNPGEQVSPWFGGYLDVTLLPALRLEDAPAGGPSTTVLSFISSDPARPCEPSWGGSYDLELAGDRLDLDAQLDAYRSAGNNVAVSFGGQKGTELAVACSDEESLARAYATVIARYGLDVVDLDIEGQGASDPAAAARRATAMARLQAERPSGKPLRVWLTLPVSRDGLTPAAAISVETMLDAGVEVAGINIMTMNFGPLPAGLSMFDASAAAAEATHRTLVDLFGKAGKLNGDEQAWSRIGLTPMIGVNDLEENVFTLDDAERLNAFARDRGIGRMSMWSLSRDTACDPEHQGVSHSCSGVEQEARQFGRLLGNGFTEAP
ncbi:chitinase, partial [Arthrobacter sp. Cr_A7]|uniref:chitinase n=1 Tax=Arthrobacter sp. Cr_A7 TaxID=3031017 RepID=UPI0023DB2FC9